MAIPSIISATPSGNELQFVTDPGLKSIDFGTRVSDTNLRALSRYDENVIVSAWGPGRSLGVIGAWRIRGGGL